MYDLSLHLLDIVENSIAANASQIEIDVFENKRKNKLVLIVKDNGSGMDEEIKKRALDPFFTTKNKKTGLGLPLLAQAAEQSGGRLKIESKAKRGTVIRAEFQLDHIDRKPLGDMSVTVRVLRAAHPGIGFRYRHRVRA